MVVATGGAGAAVVAALHLSSGGLAAAIVSGATAGAIGGATYGFTESLLSGNDAATVAKDTVIGGVSGGATGGILAGAAYGIQKGASAIGNAIKGNNTPLRQDPLGSNGGACFVAGTLVHNKCWEDPPVKKTSKKQVSIDDPKFEKWLNKGKANNTVYFGLENEEKTYVGITRQELSKRRYQHNHFGGKNFTNLSPQYENLTRNQARSLEQYHIKRGPNKRNIINSISIKNKYHDAAEEWAVNYIIN